MYRPRYFNIQELVPKGVYEVYDEELLWLLFDDRILIAADIIRDAYGPMIINDWHKGGRFDESGFRSWFTPTGAKLSQHKFGRALDLKPVRGHVNTIREKIISRELCNGLVTCVEENVSWLHIDCRMPEGEGIIKVIRP